MTPVILVLFLLSMTPIFSFCQHLQCGKDPSIENDTMSASEIIERANANITKFLIHGDIMPSLMRNADPCTARGCKWRKKGRYVYVPFTIASDFTTEQCDIILKAIVQFHRSTCIRFVWRRKQVDYLHFFSGTGCWSYIGRQGKQQKISLQKNGCVYTSTVQHEVLHALGFHHEQVRSDRDSYVKIHFGNIRPGLESNFRKVQTNNLGTPYDFNSVMQYPNYAFSKNGLPTITARCNPNLPLGCAKQISRNDIARVNRLYKCRR